MTRPTDLVLTLTAEDSETRERLEGWVAHKRGIEGDLPSGHPYKDSPP